MKSEGLALSQLVTSPLLGLSVHIYEMGKWQVDPTLFLFLTLCLCHFASFSHSVVPSLSADLCSQLSEQIHLGPVLFAEAPSRWWDGFESIAWCANDRANF